MEREIHQFGAGRDREYPGATRVQELIESRIDACPDAVALVYRQRRMTYRELGAAASEAAMVSRSAGVAPGTLVGLYLNRSLEMVIWLLAVLKSGAAYVPMDPAFPGERLRAMMEDAAIPILVTESSLANRLPSNAAKLCGWTNRSLATERIGPN